MIAGRDPISFTVSDKPGNSETVILMDSTRWPSGPVSTASGHATTGTYLTPGKDRGFLAGAVVQYTIKATTQNVTAMDQVLTGVAGTSSDWETQGSNHTVTAGTTAVVSFTPGTADFRVRVDGGATGPSAMISNVLITWPS